MRHKILLLETVAKEAQKILDAAEDIKYFYPDDAFEPSDIVGVMTRGKGRVNKELIQSLPNLKGIARIGVGVDNVDVDLATSKGIQVLNTPGVNASTMAEHTLALILMLQRRLYKAVTETKQQNWESRVNYDGDEVAGKTLGIIGMGDIGLKVSQMAEAFGMQIVYWNRTEKEVPYRFVTLEVLGRTSDIISVHLPLTSETKEILSEDFFANVKKGALLVNSARGQVLNEVALVSALNNGQLSGYAADVLSEEPPAENHPLILHPNTLITAHIGSLTKSTYDKMCKISVENLCQVVRGQAVDTKYRFNQV